MAVKNAEQVPDKKKNVKVKGKETTITLKGPDTFKSDLKGGALDEIIAPKVKAIKEGAGKVKEKVKDVGKRVKEGIKKIARGEKFEYKSKKSGIRKYHNNTYQEGK